MEKDLIYNFYESRNRCSFSRFLKARRDSAEVTSTGRSFHVRTPATKARSPVVGTRQSDSRNE